MGIPFKKETSNFTIHFYYTNTIINSNSKVKQKKYRISIEEEVEQALHPS